MLNALTESRIAVADQLFVTLDPTCRRLRFPREGDVIITDTVGFIQELPADLVTAFRATLEELADADLLLHVVDAGDPKMERKIEAVWRLLADLKMDGIPRLMVFNKSDLLEEPALRALTARYECLAVSALRRTGLEALVAAAEELIRQTECSGS